MRRARAPSRVVSLYRPSDERRALPPRSAVFDKKPAARNGFRRDFGRLVHSPAFRRLQGKTQLFPTIESEFFRNRLTHSIEVAQIAKGIALALNAGSLREMRFQIDLDLVEFAGLAHDIGHPPFGHNGEQALCYLMREDGGFEGNAQTLRVLAKTEKKLDSPDQQLAGETRERWYEAPDGEISVGLNLTSRSLAAVLKYDSVIDPNSEAVKQGRLSKGFYSSEADVVKRVKRDVLGPGQPSAKWARTIECWIMDVADDIAYSTYDLEDCFKAEVFTPLTLLSIDERLRKEIARRVSEELDMNFTAQDVLATWAAIFPNFAADFDLGTNFVEQLASRLEAADLIVHCGHFRNAVTSQLVDRFVSAVDIEVNQRQPQFSRVFLREEAKVHVSLLKQLTYVSLIESAKMKMLALRATTIVKRIFEVLSGLEGSQLLPPDWAERFHQAATVKSAQRRVVCDFIAGMTDRQAVDFYARLGSSAFQTMFRQH